MKSLSKILLVFLMVFALIGCSSSNKYKTIIDALDAEDYQKAVIEIKALANAKQQEKKESCEEVVITIENFSEYFELVHAVDAEMNEFNEYGDVTTCVGLKIKDAYVDRIFKDVSSITCDIDYSYTTKKCDFDVKTATFTNIRDSEYVGNSTQHDTKEFNLKNANSENIVCSGGLWVSAHKDYHESWSLFAGADYYQFYEFSNITLNRVVGTIYIEK